MSYHIVWAEPAEEGQYVILYEVNGPQQTITIFSIRHSRQRLLREESC